MKLDKLKTFSGKLLKKSKHKLVIDTKGYADNKEFVDKAITRQDVRDIITKGVIKRKPEYTNQEERDVKVKTI